MNLASECELEKVPYVGRYEGAILVEGAFENFAIRRGEEPTIANMAGIDPIFVRELLGHLGRDVLIEQ
jgi:hypothetical protein